MDPYGLYTCSADKSSEITHIWTSAGLPSHALLCVIEDSLNDFLLRVNAVTIDPSGAMSFRWKTRTGDTIITTPSAFKTWFFTGVKRIDTPIPVARPPTPSSEDTMEHPKFDDNELLDFLLTQLDAE
jgi:hypothetical protein